MVTRGRRPFPREEIEVRPVARDDDAPLLVGEVHEGPIGETREPAVRGQSKHVVPQRTKGLTYARGGEMSIEQQPHLATSSE